MKKKEKHALVTLLHRLVNESLEVEYVCLASAMEQEVGAGVVWEERLKEMRGAVADMEGRIAELGKTNEMLTWWLEQAEDKLRAVSGDVVATGIRVWIWARRESGW